MSTDDRDRLADALENMGATAPQPAASRSPQPLASSRMDPPPVAAPAPVASVPPADADDLVAAPAPDESVFAPRQSTAQLLAKERLEQKRMFIPILLTTGVLLPAIASLKWITGSDSVFAEMETWVPLVLIATGVTLLAVAAINMMQVRHELRALSARRRR